MNIAKISIKNPTFILCIMLGIIVVGVTAFKTLSVDLFPSINIPIVSVTTIYPGAGPSEIENLVSRPLEEQIASISGLKRLSSKSLEGVSQVVAEFKDGVKIDRVEQEVRDKVNLARATMPRDIKEPIIRRFDPADQPIVTLALSANLKQAELYDLADKVIKPRLEQVNNVGAIEIYGGRKREIHVLLDRKKLEQKEMSVSQVSGQIGASGENIPSGKVNVGAKEISFRGLGEFETVAQISDVLVNLYGNEVPTKIGTIGKVVDTLEDEKTRTFVEGKPSLFLYVYRQAGTNTIEVSDGIKASVDKLNLQLKSENGTPQLQILVDAKKNIKNNVDDVYETIVIAIFLTVVTVFFFLGNFRTTIITALALPVSLLGSFVVMKYAGFSINILTLLALSLAVGLLVDDAIVVIENIHRRIKSGESPMEASEKGTGEIQLSVFAITLVVISVFVPVGFMSGTVGQFFKEFGLTVAFAMGVSFLVALTLIPMLSAYFIGSHEEETKPSFLYTMTIGKLLSEFNRFQNFLESMYVWLLTKILRRPFVALIGSLVIFLLSFVVASKIPSSFVGEKDFGEVMMTYELAPGTSLDGTQKAGELIDKIVKSNKNVALVTLTVGGKNGEANKGQFFIRLKSGKEREGTTAKFKENLRLQLKDLAYANPVVKDYDASGGLAGQPIMLNLTGTNADELNSYALKLIEHLKNDPRVKDLDTNYRPGKPEFRIKLRPEAANTYGINSKTMGVELRGQVEGFTPAKFRTEGKEYDIRVRLLPEQRNIKEQYSKVLVPNINHRLVRLSDITKTEELPGPSEINRQDRGRYIQITASVGRGVGVSSVTNDIENYLKAPETKIPDTLKFNWAGDVENMKDMRQSAMIAVGFAVLLIYFILSSLYGSFVTPLTILTALPLAICGAFYALFIAKEFISIFAILGFFLLLGVAGKNSILLVDFANQMMAEGLSRNEAILRAGKTRLRPILMTSFALIAGTIPVAIGLNEISKMRTAMGWGIIGGVISSTLLTLIVVPALFSYVDRYRVWSKKFFGEMFLPKK